MDVTTIIIKQNRCFKEVIKELELYEKASEARINYTKTKGLWVGSWKGRRISPLNIEWTSGNVKNLGIYFGNDNPSYKTFEEITPNLKGALHIGNNFHFLKLEKQELQKCFWHLSFSTPLSFIQSLQTFERKYRIRFSTT